MTNIQRLMDELGTWADATFSVARDPGPSIAHLAEEISELAAAPHDRFEYADCLMLLLDAYRNAGGSADDLVTAGFQKLEINRLREWDAPDVDGIVRHRK